MAEEQNKFASTSPDYQPSPAYLGGTIQENLTARGMPEPLTFSKESLGQLTNIYRNENVADPTAALAQDIATTISGEFPEDPNWFSYPSLTTGKGFAGAFNDGIPMTPMDIIELFSVDTEGEPIKMPTLFGSEKLGTIFQGVKEEAIPALAEAGSFAAGFKLTNDYLNRIKYKGSAVSPYFRGVQKGVSRFALPTVAGLFSAATGRFGGEKIQELTFGPDVPLLPEAEALYKIGQGTTEGLGYSAIPYAMSKNISLGYELIKDDLTRGMLKQPGQQASKLFKYAPTVTGKGTLASAESMLQGIAQTSKAAPFTYALAEGASNLGAGLAQAQNQLDPSVPVMEFAREFGYSLLGGYSADVLTKKVPYVAGQLNKGRKAVQGFVFGGKEFRDKAQAARQEKLQGEIADWLFKALQDAGEDPKEVAKLLNSREFSDLLDSDGSPVKPTAGTKSLSPTLLGLEGALNFIGNGLQGQRATAQQAITDGIRQKIRGLYATGDRDAVQEAAAMMEGTFEASINKRVYEARKNLDDAFKRIQKDSKGVPVAASKDEAKKMFELFDELIKADRARERALWKRIPENVEISEFVDGKGKPLSVPNFIKYWNENVSNLVKEAKIPLDNDLIDSLGAFVARKTDELNLSGEQAVVAVDTRLQKAREKFQDLYAGVAATPEAQAAFQRAVNEVSQLPPQEQAAAFKAISSDKLGKSSTPRSREVAKAYDAYANLLVIQNNLDTPPVAEASQVVSEAVQSAQEIFARNTQRFNAYLDNPNFSIQSEARDNLRAVQAVARRIENLDDPDDIQRVVDDWVNANAESRTQQYTQRDPQGRGGQFLPDSTFTTDARGFLDSAAALRRAQLENPAATPEAAAEVATATADVGTLSGKELFQMRSTALALGRKLDAGGDANGARLAHGFATALLDDLKSFPQGVNFAYDTARAYSVAFNNAYTKTFAGDLSATDKSGARKIAPELLKRELQGVDLAYLHVKQLDQVGQFQQQQLLSTLIDGSQLDAALRGNLFGAQTSDRPDVVKLREGFEGVIDPESEMLDLPKYENWLKANKSLLDEVAPDLYEESIKVLGTANTVRGTTENVLRNIRENAIDETTGKVTPTSLAKWMQQDNNALMLKAFPALEADLSNMSRLNVLLDKTSAEAKQSINAVKAQSSFYQLMKSNGLDVGGTENPTTAINKALRPSNEKPIESLNRLFLAIGQLDVKNKPLGNLTVDPMRTEGVTTDLQRGAAEDVLGFDSALQGPTSVVKFSEDAAGKKIVEPTGTTINREEALLGFRVSLIEEVLSKSGINANNGAFSATAAYKNFFEPLPNSQNNVSVAEWAESKGVMAAGQLDNMKKLLGEMAKYEQTLMSGDAKDFEDLVKKMGPGLDIALSILGSSAGTRARNVLVGPGGSGDLIVSGRAAEAARNAGRTLLEKAPEVARMTMLTKMFEDPELLGALLAKAKTPEKKASFALKAYNIMLDFLEPSSSAYRLVRPALVQDKPEEETSVITEKPDFLMGDRKRFTVTPERQQQMKQEFYERYVAPEEAEKNVDELLQKAREFLDTREDASLQPLPRRDLPPSTQTAAPSGVQTASVDPAGSAAQRPQSGGISSIDINKARQLFPNDITFAARGGEMRSGIGGLFR